MPKHSRESQQSLPIKPKDKSIPFYKKTSAERATDVGNLKVGGEMPEPTDVIETKPKRKHFMVFGDDIEIFCGNFRVLDLPVQNIIFYLPGTANAAHAIEITPIVAKNLASHFRAHVIVPQHRTSCANKYPNPLNDVIGVINEYIKKFKKKSSRDMKFALAGYSSGGMMAIQLIMHLIEQQKYEIPFHQVILFSPVTTFLIERDRKASDANIINGAFFEEIRKDYIPRDVDYTRPPYSPLEYKIGKFKNFPPTTIVCGTEEYLYPDVKAFATKLDDSDSCVLENLNGEVHSYMWKHARHLARIAPRVIGLFSRSRDFDFAGFREIPFIPRIGETTTAHARDIAKYGFLSSTLMPSKKASFEGLSLPVIIPRGAEVHSVYTILQTQKDHCAFIAGTGGSGKSTLAVLTALEHLDDYNFIARFDFSSDITLIKTLRACAKDLGLVLPKEAMSAKKILKHIYKFTDAHKIKCLFIFDDILNYEQFEPFRPKHELGQKNLYHHMIVTTRSNVRWHKKRKVELTTFNEEESQDFIAQFLTKPEFKFEVQRLSFLLTFQGPLVGFES